MGMPPAKGTEKVPEYAKVFFSETVLQKAWRVLRRKPRPYELVEIKPVDPPQPVRGHVRMLKK